MRTATTIAVSVLLLAVVAGCGAPSPAASGGADQQAADPPAAVAKLGQPARDGTFEFVVAGMQCGLKRVGDQYFGDTAQGQFCLVDLSVRNIGDAPQHLFGDNQYLFNAAGQRFAPDTGAAIYLKDANTFVEQINPGNTVRGKLVFDVPPGAQFTEIELHDSAFSAGVRVALT